MELQNRDREIIQFISDYKIATIRIIHELFFNQNTSSESCRRRLQKLSQAGYIQMYRDGFGREHLYRMSPREAREVEDQRLMVGRFVSKLASSNYNILHYEVGLKVGGVLYDWVGYVEKNGKCYVLFVMANLNRPYPNIKIDKSVEHHIDEYNQFEKSEYHLNGVLFIALTDLKVMKTKHIDPVAIPTTFDNLTLLDVHF